MNSFIIGKHTLESLTTGMYVDAKIVYREYVQNSVDAIDEAIKMGIIKKKNAKIFIEINEKNKKIMIEDNGAGISVKDASKKLLDIGNSKKDHRTNRGFRGIGRLSGLSYCSKLKFETSHKGEDKKTIVSFNSKRLEKLLIPGDYMDYDLLKVIEEVTTKKIESEDSNKHYFRVILEEVNNIDHILNYNRIKNYLSQIAPVPFDERYFDFSTKLKKEFEKKNILINEYNIFLSDGEETEQIYKLNSSNFVSDIRKKISDYVKSIEIEFIKDKDENLLAALWYTKSNFYGTIVDRKIKGLRFRKGNIQIGDRSLLNKIFKEDRFNGWFQGEVYVLDDDLIPNARRDGFEKNSAYAKLINELEKIGSRLSKLVRSASKKKKRIEEEKKFT
ncbi:ATP-binding protein [Natroniella sulfidigena]|uniref:ATP-binding protein n=1 Tax=Natroniella sulfidigena TaxID=723921 RepID=UPI00200ACD40|nr:ATP-binding protein [Natroniella sulfidigena]MCK8817166.1 ATP-binding protein [Natroniella sulfidigena]